jgi:hypothetical protein
MNTHILGFCGGGGELNKRGQSERGRREPNSARSKETAEKANLHGGVLWRKRMNIELYLIEHRLNIITCNIIYYFACSYAAGRSNQKIGFGCRADTHRHRPRGFPPAQRRHQAKMETGFDLVVWPTSSLTDPVVVCCSILSRRQFSPIIFWGGSILAETRCCTLLGGATDLRCPFFFFLCAPPRHVSEQSAISPTHTPGLFSARAVLTPTPPANNTSTHSIVPGGPLVVTHTMDAAATPAAAAAGPPAGVASGSGAAPPRPPPKKKRMSRWGACGPCRRIKMRW